MTLQEQEQIQQFIKEELQNLENSDIDKSSVTTEIVREIIREELPALLAKSITTIDGNLQLLDGRNIFVGSVTGTQIATSTSQKLGFFAKAPVVQQADGAGLTNNVTVGGTTDTIADITDITTYSNAGAGAAIRNDLYQLARKVKIIGDALRTYGFLS